MKRGLTVSIIIIIVSFLVVMSLSDFSGLSGNRNSREKDMLPALRSGLYIYYVRDCADRECQYPPDLESIESAIVWDRLFPAEEDF